MPFMFGIMDATSSRYRNDINHFYVGPMCIMLKLHLKFTQFGLCRADIGVLSEHIDVGPMSTL